uniref:Ig-like domain-containing protein n=1 Tax=Salmo trutta TaxID=8032 RepID=A0A673YUH5_SALTR
GCTYRDPLFRNSDLWGSNNATLLCLVSGFFPSDVIVNWEKAGSRLPFSRYSSIPSVLYAGSSTYSMNSRLIVPRSEWDQNSNYSCAVRHESSERPITHTIENVFGEWTVDLNTSTVIC